MKTLTAIASIALAGSPCTGAGLPRSSPEEQGIPSSAVLSFVEAADRAPRDPERQWYLAESYRLLGDSAAAAQAYPRGPIAARPGPI